MGDVSATSATAWALSTVDCLLAAAFWTGTYTLWSKLTTGDPVEG